MSQSYYDDFGHPTFSPTPSYSNDDDDLVDYDGYIESLRDIATNILQNPNIPPNYSISPSCIPTSTPYHAFDKENALLSSSTPPSYIMSTYSSYTSIISPSSSTFISQSPPSQNNASSYIPSPSPPSPYLPNLFQNPPTNPIYEMHHPNPLTLPSVRHTSPKKFTRKPKENSSPTPIIPLTSSYHYHPYFLHPTYQNPSISYLPSIESLQIPSISPLPNYKNFP